jgi:hypothetical protein
LHHILQILLRTMPMQAWLALWEHRCARKQFGLSSAALALRESKLESPLN